MNIVKSQIDAKIHPAIHRSKYNISTQGTNLGLWFKPSLLALTKGAVGTNQMLLVFREGVNIYTVVGDAQYLFSKHGEISYCNSVIIRNVAG